MRRESVLFSTKEVTMRKAILGVAWLSTVLGMAVGCGSGLDRADEDAFGAEESVPPAESALHIPTATIVCADAGLGRCTNHVTVKGIRHW